MKKSACENKQATFGEWEGVLFGWSRASKRAGEEGSRAVSLSRYQSEMHARPVGMSVGNKDPGEFQAGTR